MEGDGLMSLKRESNSADLHCDQAGSGQHEATSARGGKRAGRGGKADATRQQLLDAALVVIGEKGYSAATVDEIVEAAGVSKGVAYYHFKNKAAMAESILEEGIGNLIEEFEHIATEASGSAEALTGMIEQFAIRIFENKAFGRFFVSELWREGRVWSGAMRGYEKRLLDVLEGQLARGQAEGIIRTEIDPAFEAVALVGMVLTTTLYYIVDEDTAGLMPGKVMPIRSHSKSGDSPVSANIRSRETLGKDAFIERICDFVRHANACPELLSYNTGS